MAILGNLWSFWHIKKAWKPMFSSLWQRYKDSNLKWRSQSPECYRYTIPLYSLLLCYYNTFFEDIKSFFEVFYIFWKFFHYIFYQKFWTIKFTSFEQRSNALLKNKITFKELCYSILFYVLIFGLHSNSYLQNSVLVLKLKKQ